MSETVKRITEDVIRELEDITATPYPHPLKARGAARRAAGEIKRLREAMEFQAKEFEEYTKRLLGERGSYVERERKAMDDARRQMVIRCRERDDFNARVSELEAAIRDRVGVEPEAAMPILEWGSVAPRPMTWDEAMAWCAEQGDGWRAPRPSELLVAFEDGVGGFGRHTFWSSSSYAGSSPSAWPVDFSSGYVYYAGKAGTGYARCVRVRPTTPEPVEGSRCDETEEAGDDLAASDPQEPTDDLEPLVRIAEISRELEPDALTILRRIGERLLSGRDQYGDLDLETDRRDFVRETLEECADGLVYLQARLEQIR